jgi:hypothetical protein
MSIGPAYGPASPPRRILEDQACIPAFSSHMLGACTKQWPIVAKPHIFDTDWKRAGCPASGDTMQMGGFQRPVLVKRYAGRRLYRPATSAYLTREDLMTMAKNGEEFVVIDADTQENVTRSYRPIIVEH